METGPIFIVGQQRSGTTFLYACLSKTREFSSAPRSNKKEKFLIYNFLASNARFWIGEDLLISSLMQRFDTFYKRAYGNSAGRWIDATPGNWEYIDDILHYFPTARIIFIIRNPLEVISSDFRRCRYFRNKDEFIRERALLWKKMAAQYVTCMKPAYNNHVLLLRHDQCVRDPIESLQTVLSFLGIDANNRDAYDELLYLPNRRDSFGRREKFRNFGDYRSHFKETVLRELNADLELCCKTMTYVEEEVLALGFNKYILERIEYDLKRGLHVLKDGAPCALFGATTEAKIITKFLNNHGIYPRHIRDNNIMNIKESFDIPLRSGAHPVPLDMKVLPASRSSKYIMAWQLIEQHKLPPESILLGFINRADEFSSLSETTGTAL